MPSTDWRESFALFCMAGGHKKAKGSIDSIGAAFCALGGGFQSKLFKLKELSQYDFDKIIDVGRTELCFLTV